jgi:hypothetical protein
VDTAYSRWINCQKDKRWIANPLVMLFSKTHKITRLPDPPYSMNVE